MAFEGFALFFNFSSAQVTEILTPRKIDCSAYIISKNGEELTNGEYDIRFALYSQDRTANDSSSESDQKIWEETQKINNTNGIIKTFLGTKTPLLAGLDFSSGDYYLGIKIRTDSEMVPRKKLVAGWTCYLKTNQSRTPTS